MSGSGSGNKVPDPDMIWRQKVDVRIGLRNKGPDPDLLQIHTSHVRIGHQKQGPNPEDPDPDKAMSGSSSRAAGMSGSGSEVKLFPRENVHTD